MSSKDQSTEEQRLAPIRDKIDALDAQILDLLSQRAKAAQEVGHIKGGFYHLRYLGRRRRRQVVARLQELSKGPLLADGIAAIWREVMSACRALEARQTIPYLGPVGTFSEQAAQTYFGHSIAGFFLAIVLMRYLRRLKRVRLNLEWFRLRKLWRVPCPNFRFASRFSYAY